VVGGEKSMGMRKEARTGEGGSDRRGSVRLYRKSNVPGNILPPGMKTPLA